MLNKLRKIVVFILDLIEIYIPTFCITVTFISFLLQIFSRYILRNQVEWSYELTLIGFLWCLILAAANASRTNSHVAFTLFYDRVNEKTRLVMRLIANLFVLIVFIILIGPAWDFVDFMSIKKTSVLKVSMKLLFLPFVVFVALTWCHTAYGFYKDLKEIIQTKRDRKKEQAT